MSFFNLLTWNNKHMDLRFVPDELHGNVNITKVYGDNRQVDLERVNEKYADELKSTQSAINSYRLVMLVAFSLLVFLPAVLLGVIQGNVLLVGGIVVYAVIAYFVLEAVNQVAINKVLYEIDNDKEIHAQP